MTSGQAQAPSLVIGANGCLGAAVRRVLAARGVPALASGRDPASSIFVDLEASPETWRLPPAEAGGVAFLLAARTNTAACESDPEAAWRVNVQATLELARRLAGQGYFLVFASSSQVFDGERLLPSPDDAPNPVTVYGRHKAEIEARLRAEFPGQAAILRLAKVLDGAGGLVPRWVESLSRGQSVSAFDDMRMAPVTVAEAGEALVDAGHRPGIHHFSAARDMTYYEAACLGARVLGADPSLVQAVACAGRGLFAPAHTCLRMDGAAPDPAAAVVFAFKQAQALVAA